MNYVFFYQDAPSMNNGDVGSIPKEVESAKEESIKKFSKDKIKLVRGRRNLLNHMSNTLFDIFVS